MTIAARRHDTRRVHLSQRRRRFSMITIVAALAVVAAGCSDEQRRSLGEQDVRDVLERQVREAITAHGSELDGALACRSAISTDDTVTASCDGRTTTGDEVTGTVRGSADVDAERCTGAVSITVAGAPIVADVPIDCFGGGET